MSRHGLLRSWLLLVVLLVAACGLPNAAAPPTPAPIAVPPATAAPTAALAATALPPTVAASTATSVVAQSQLDPTQLAACQQPGASVLPECVVPQLELPTPLAVPFAQALQQFTGRTLLYLGIPGLMLGDPDSGASLWISGAFCPLRSTRAIYGEWSADGQFIAFVCQDLHYNATIYLLDMQTADGHQIAVGDAAEFAWSPTVHRLLVAEQTDVQRAFELDVATGATAALPFAPLWENNGGYPMNVGPAIPKGGWFINSNHAAMAWSPDGMRIAEPGAVLDADIAHARDGKLALLMTFDGGAMRRPQWSHDGRFLYTVAPHQNHTDPLSPSSEFGAIALRTELSTGVITSTYPAEPVWSPDRQAYMAWSPATADGPSDGSWALYQADRSLTRAITDVLAADPFWTPDSQQVLLLPFGDQGSRLVALDLAGQERTILTANKTVGEWRDFHLPISPDSELLAFTVELPNLPIDQRGRVVVYDFQGQQRAIFKGVGTLGWRAR